ncbi:DJ-1/PfpI family protein [Mycobacteroides sp. LB1]|uniref:DJ-1/PfpI family protein n=1 Tax=Mycobacteroides sp. LB1 TaxID=2750814 RepID=UPI0015DE397F|nr:DJ-1/PfpI family protein [Mycobacteroides sp. LB1]
MAPDDASVTRIAMLLYPQFTTLDLIGPHQVLSALPNTEVDLVAKTADAVTSDSGVSIIPDQTFEGVGPGYDVIFVPGGPCTYEVIDDADTLSFVRSVGVEASYVTSVCTGSLILAAAGLLTGYRAASHWAFREILSVSGATPEDERIVIDRNRITGGGVTAGIDFGLHLAAILAGEEVAKTLELIMEYDPHPPFNVGHPSRADGRTLALATDRLAPGVALTKQAAGRVAASR